MLNKASSDSLILKCSSSILKTGKNIVTEFILTYNKLLGENYMKKTKNPDVSSHGSLIEVILRWREDTCVVRNVVRHVIFK